MTITIISDEFLRATDSCSTGRYYRRARVLAMAILSVRLGCHDPRGSESSPGQIETPGFHRVIDSLESLVSNEIIWCRWVRRFPSNEGIKEGYPS